MKFSGWLKRSEDSLKKAVVVSRLSVQGLVEKDSLKKGNLGKKTRLKDRRTPCKTGKTNRKTR